MIADAAAFQKQIADDDQMIAQRIEFGGDLGCLDLTAFIGLPHFTRLVGRKHLPLEKRPGALVGCAIPIVRDSELPIFTLFLLETTPAYHAA